MKNYILALFTSFCLFASVYAAPVQTPSVESYLDQALALTEKGDKSGSAEALTQGAAALEKEANTTGGDLKSKILGQAGNLKSLIPLASGGKLSSGVLGKAVSTIKMLIGANRISSLLGKGDSGLLGKGASLTSSLGLIKAGSSVLGSGTQNELGGLLGQATKLVGGVDKKGFAGTTAAKAASQPLGSIVKLVSSAL